MAKPPKKVVVTGGAGQIAYSILFRIASGELLGSDQAVDLRILEVPEALEAAKGVFLELQDCAYPLLSNVHVTSEAQEAFEDAHLAILIGAKPRGPGMERKDLLKENAKIFVEQGRAINEKANRDALVFVVGNPCNTNALIALKNAPNFDPRQFFSMTRLDENRAKGQLAFKAGVNVGTVSQVAVWGNHSATQVPDFIHAKIQGKEAVEVIQDRNWLMKEFIETVQKRGAAIIETRGKSSAASAANAAIDGIRSLLNPTKEGDWFSCGIYSKGNPYGIDEDLVFSFPCRSKGEGKVEIVPGLEWDDFLQERIAITEKDLIDERSSI